MSLRLSRRAFVQATGVSSALVPLLATDRTSWAAGTGGPKRVIIVNWPNGVRADEWYPDTAKGKVDYASDGGASGTTETNFTFKGRRMSEPLEPHRQDLLLLNGISLKAYAEFPNGAGHNDLCALLTGLPHKGANNANGPSVDQFLGDKLASRFRTLALGVQAGNGNKMTWRGPDSGVTPENDPYALFANLFSGPTVDAMTLDRQRAARRSIFDFVGKQLTTFGVRLGTEDRARLNAHTQSVRDLEKRLVDTKSVGGEMPETLAGAKFDVKKTENFHLVSRAQTDLLVAALASDQTRVVTLQMAEGTGFNLVCSWLGPEYAPAPTGGGLGNDNNHHSHAHAEDEKHIVMQRWFVEQFAYLIDKLKRTSDVRGGTLFDNTVVVVINNMNTGGGHGTSRLPIFLAGSAGGYFKTGRYLRFSTSVPINGLLVGLCNAMDVPVETFGDPKYGGELAGLRG